MRSGEAFGDLEGTFLVAFWAMGIASSWLEFDESHKSEDRPGVDLEPVGAELSSHHGLRSRWIVQEVVEFPQFPWSSH